MKAIVYFDPKTNHGITGTVRFNQKSTSKKMKIKIDLKGFKNNKPHAIHIHQYGDISAEK